jgi:hypothetical protein
VIRRHAPKNGRRIASARALVAILFAGPAFAWSSGAQAHPEYPQAIDAALGLKKTVEMILPQSGCRLCHTSDSGGTELNSFGSLLVSSYGLSNDPIAAHVPSLQQALMGLQAGDPKAIEDLKNGVDPNTDSVVFENALPTPQYGCSLAREPLDSAPGASALLTVGAAILFYRARSRSCCEGRRPRRST